MTTYNEITGDALQSKVNSEAYRNNFDAIFGKKEKKPAPQTQEQVSTDNSEESETQ